MRELVKFLNFVINKKIITKKEDCMEIILTKEHMTELFTNYYQQKEGNSFEVQFGAFELSNYQDDYGLSVQLKGTMNFLGREVSFNRRVPNEEIREALSDMIDDTCYRMVDFSVYTVAHNSSVEEFKLLVEQKEKQKVKGGR